MSLYKILGVNASINLALLQIHVFQYSTVFSKLPLSYIIIITKIDSFK